MTREPAAAPVLISRQEDLTYSSILAGFSLAIAVALMPLAAPTAPVYVAVTAGLCSGAVFIALTLMSYFLAPFLAARASPLGSDATDALWTHTRRCSRLSFVAFLLLFTEIAAAAWAFNTIVGIIVLVFSAVVLGLVGWSVGHIWSILTEIELDPTAVDEFIRQQKAP